LIRVFYDEDADPAALQGETVAVLGYGIQGRAQAHNLRDSGVAVVVGNRDDDYRRQARQDGFAVFDLEEAAGRGTLLLMLLPDEVQPRVYREQIEGALEPGKALVFAHGFALRYGLVRPPDTVDLLLCAPRMPGHYLRSRYLEGWGVPAFVDVERDASGRAWSRLLGLCRALGITRCGALQVSFAQETELDHFSEHFTYPLVFSVLEQAFLFLVEQGYPPEAALMETYGSEEMGLVLLAAAREGLYAMLSSHASPACQVGVAAHWDPGPGTAERMGGVLQRIRRGDFARFLVEEQERGYPGLARWKAGRSPLLAATEERLRQILRPAPRV
jgi:ketol-acid reductoisomerase